MTIHASSDYLVDWLTTDSTSMSLFISNATAMKWIGLRDYVCDKLMNIASIKSAMLGSDNWEYILKDHVPVMTSNTAPYGECFSTANESSCYKIFDNSDATYFMESSQSVSGRYVGYKFANPICIKKVSFLHVNTDPSGSATNINTMKLQISNDGTNWIDVDNGKTFQNDNVFALKSVDFDNDVYALYARIYKTNSQSNVQYGFYTLQFYGRSLNVSVPTMTSNTAPYGEVIYHEKTANSAYYAFLEGDYWQTSGVTDGWVGYNFNKSVVIKMIEYNPLASNDKSGVTVYDSNIKVQYSDNGIDWKDIDTIPLAKADAYKTLLYALANETSGKYIRILFTNRNKTWSSIPYCTMNHLQFYGVDYSEREFASDSTMHYIYDHGVEFEDIKTYKAGNVTTEKRDLELYASVNSKDTTSLANFHIGLIELSPYSIVRTVMGDEYQYLTNIPNIQVTTNNAFTSVTKYKAFSDLPFNCVLDISDVNDSEYVALSTNMNNVLGNKYTINEWWLE